MTGNFRSAEVIQVIRVVTYEGNGTPESIGREVSTYLTTDGKSVLAIFDPAPENASA